MEKYLNFTMFFTVWRDCSEELSNKLTSPPTAFNCKTLYYLSVILSINLSAGLEGLDYVERAHEVLEDQLGHHPYMGICVQTLAQYHDDMLSINFSSEYNQVINEG